MIDMADFHHTAQCAEFSFFYAMYFTVKHQSGVLAVKQ